MSMLAMVLEDGRLTPVLRPVPQPLTGEVLLRVRACGVCRTDLHLLDGELPVSTPIVPGHEIVGEVVGLGAGVTGLSIGQRVGVPWLGGTCGRCDFCRSDAENLCDGPTFTGWTRDGGFAQMTTADSRFCIALPEGPEDATLAPLLCAGLIGFRAWRMACAATPIQRLGLYGFGAAAHLLAQLAMAEGQKVFAFTKPDDRAAQDLARDVGCLWAGGSDHSPPEPLDAAILFAPIGDLVPIALRAVRKGGAVVCSGIHMSRIPGFDYVDLWGERKVMSVANLTRADAHDYLPRAVAAGVTPHVRIYELGQAQRALDDLRAGRFAGAAVLKVG